MPPAELSSELVDSLDGSSPDELRRIASYVEELVEYREREARLDQQDEVQSDDLSDDVPSEATITTKEINDNRYDYWQWRDGDQVKSKYKGPVSPDE